MPAEHAGDAAMPDALASACGAAIAVLRNRHDGAPIATSEDLARAVYPIIRRHFAEVTVEAGPEPASLLPLYPVRRDEESDWLGKLEAAVVLGREVACELVYRNWTVSHEHPNKSLKTRSVPADFVAKYVGESLGLDEDALRMLAARIVDEAGRAGTTLRPTAGAGQDDLGKAGR